MPDSPKSELPLSACSTDLQEKVSTVTQKPEVHRQLTLGAGREFLTAFLTIFLAELGDKTQLATLLIAAESQSPWVVFMGAATALITISLLGVLLGRWLASRLSPGVLQTATGASLLLISVLLLWDVVHL
jgi:putative Ca2+/H+ antiporter (TMEM165/GDT1 family)